MPLEVLSCTSNDVPTIVSIYFKAFQNILARVAFPDKPPVRKWWTDMLSNEILDPNALFLKVVDRQTQEEPGEIIAWGKWNKPTLKDNSDQGLPVWPEGGDSDLSNEFFSALAEKHAKNMQSPHWYLELIATLPAHQGRGAGSLLISHVLHQVDKEGDKAYLEGSPEGITLYQKFGFKQVDRIDIVVQGEPYYNLCMVREPKKDVGT